MNILKKKITVGLIALSLFVVPVIAQGATAAELQAQIDQLLATLTQLQSQLGDLQGTTPASTPAAISGIPSGFTFDNNMSLGASGVEVKYLQIVLNSDADTQLAVSGVGSAGNETTYFGPLTKAAVVKFQEKYASEVLASWGFTSGTGYVGSTTRAKLNSLLTATTGGTGGTGDTGGTGGTVTPVSEGLSVAFADDNPASATIVADSTSGESAQSMIPFLKVTFTNGDASDVKVTQFSAKRSGISADSDISQAYLYDGNTQLAEYNSFSSGILTFSNSAGLFTVPAGGSKTVTLKADLANGTNSGKTIRFSVDSASSVVSDASAVNGTFPMAGNNMSTAQTSDIGQLTVATSTSPAANVDPQTGLVVFNFTLAGADQKLEVRKLKFTNIGSTDYTDLANFKLYDGGTQINDTIATMNSDKTVTFDLSANPLVINKGVTKVMNLKADIVSGTNRSFQFSIQNMTDISVYDTQYGIFVKPNKADSWTVFKMTSSTINTGKMTISRASDSPSGNVALDGTNITVAKFDVKATGEDVKITTMNVRTYGTINLSDLYQGKVYFDGAQKGSTANLNSSSTDSSTANTAFAFGNTFIVPADGSTHTLEIVADIKKGDGTSYSGTETFTVAINSSTAAQGKSSLATVSVSTAAGYQLTITTGALSAALNQAVPSWTSSNPTGVTGATEVLVGSFVVTAGASEGADVTAVVAQFTTTTNTILQNLKIYNGTKDSGTQIGNTQSSVTATTDYTFYPSPYISLSKSQQVTLNVYADILTGSPTSSQGYITLGTISGTGKVTNTSVNSSGTVIGQTVYVASAGSLTIAADSNQPKAAQIIMGTSGVEFNKVKFTAGAGEAINVTKMVVTAVLGSSPTTPTSTVKNISLWDGTAQIGSTAASLNAAGTATFDISSNPWQVPANGEKKLTIKADVNSYTYATSSGTVKLGFAATDVTYKGAVSGSGSTGGSVAGNAMETYKTKVVVDLDSASPSGSSIKGANQEVLRVKIVNDGSYDATLNNATFTIAYSAGSGNTTTSAARAFNLYDSADLNSAIATTSVDAATDLTNGTTTLVFAPSTALTIPAGQSKVIVLKGDTTDVGTGTNPGSFRFDIAAISDFGWKDGTAISANIMTLTKNLPIYGNVLTY